jgi:hypothetical protein
MKVADVKKYKNSSIFEEIKKNQQTLLLEYVLFSLKKYFQREREQPQASGL